MLRIAIYDKNYDKCIYYKELEKNESEDIEKTIKEIKKLGIKNGVLEIHEYPNLSYSNNYGVIISKEEEGVEIEYQNNTYAFWPDIGMTGRDSVVMNEVKDDLIDIAEKMLKEYYLTDEIPDPTNIINGYLEE